MKVPQLLSFNVTDSTVSELLLSLKDAPPDAKIDRISMDISWLRDETKEETEARLTVEKLRTDLKNARDALAAAQLAQAEMCKTGPKAVSL